MRTLLIDIETSPNRADVWGLWNVNVGLPQLRESSFMMCWGAKWHGEKRTIFRSYYHDGKEEMVQKAWDLMDESDAIVHYNGKRFDIPTLNKEFLLQGLGPPSPSKQIDLCSVVKKNFRFPSNKLAYVLAELGFEGKLSHEGHALWTKCLAEDPAAWKRFKAYCLRDVTELGPLYDRLLPWIQGHPNVNLFDETNGCPSCGSENYQKRGFTYTGVSKFQQYRCTPCGRWFKSGKRIDGAGFSGVSL